MPAITLFSYSSGNAKELPQNAPILQQIQLLILGKKLESFL